VSFISFYTDESGFPAYRADDNRYVPLGVWFVMELRNSPYQCLDLLALVDDAAAGRSSDGEWEGEAFHCTVTTSGVTVQNTILDDQQGTYSLAEVRQAAEDYWRQLPEPSRIPADLADWERSWNRPHPYRGRLF